jgi:hypothetical protein
VAQDIDPEFNLSTEKTKNKQNTWEKFQGTWFGHDFLAMTTKAQGATTKQIYRNMEKL